MSSHSFVPAHLLFLILLFHIHTAFCQPLSSLSPAPRTTTYLPITVLRRLKSLSNASLHRLAAESPATRPSSSLQTLETEIIFQALNLTLPLVSVPRNGRYVNNQASIIASSSINEPFVSRVSPEAASIRRFVRDVSNDTARPGDAFQWADGSASVHHIRSSRVHVVQLCCHVIILYDTLHRARSNPRFTYIRALPPFKSVLVRMLPSDGPLHCAGSGRIFSEHGAGSQRLWISGSSTRGKASGIGEVTDDQLSEGNRIVDLSDELREKMDRIYDGDVIGPSGAVLNILTEVEEEFTRGLDEYNNVAFLILSVAAILSSAAIATVSPVREWEGLAVVLVEAIVVYSFLGIVSHATVVFNRADTFAVDIRHRSHGNFTYNGRIVQVFRESVIMTVGEPLKKAVMLLITEGFAVAAAVMVSVTLAASVRQVRLSKKRRDASADGMDEKEA